MGAALDLVHEATRRYQEDGVDAVLELVDPDIVIDASRQQLNPAVYHGHDGYRAFLADIRDVWSSLDLEFTEELDLGDRAITAGRIHGVGAASGVRVDQEFVDVWMVRDGRIVRWEIGHASVEEARRATAS
jgi:ketosteroid isomerase-like protein